MGSSIRGHRQDLENECSEAKSTRKTEGHISVVRTMKDVPSPHAEG